MFWKNNLLATIASCLLLVMLLIRPVQAVMVNDLYDINLPRSTGQEAEQKVLFSQAFDKLLIRLTGNKVFLTSAEIIKAKENIDAYISSFDATNIKFNETEVHKLLKTVKQSFLGKNRPLIMVCLLLAKPEYDFINENNNLEIITTLENIARDRKLPIITPLLDLTDLGMLNKEDILAGNFSQLQAMAGRYVAKSVLLGKIQQNTTDPNTGWQVDWQLVEANNVKLQFSNKEKNLDNLFELSIDELLNKLINQTATTTTMERHIAVKIKLHITEIADIEDYSKIFSYLQGLSAISKVETMGIETNKATFILHTEAGVNGIAELFARDRVLQNTEETKPDQSNSTMNYRYTKWN